MNKPYRVGILGATGAVGQTFVKLLANHPWFEVSALAASARSVGKPYREATHWLSATPMPNQIADLPVLPCTPTLPCDFVFSGLDAAVAGDVECAFAQAGLPVISNAKNHRMAPQVPLLIPEVNPQHTALIQQQPWLPGFIVTNPNCATVGLASALQPLHQTFGIDAVHVTSFQALSGAGYPGVAALDALDNVVPFIAGEEEKVASEPLKLLGHLKDGRIEPATFPISATCTRVPVRAGHLLSVSVQLKNKATPADVARAWQRYENPIAKYDLPSAPATFLTLFDRDAAPQPRLHAGLHHGMAISLGRLRACPVLGIQFLALVHNTIRGAAGGAILIAELLAQQRLFANKPK